MRGCIKASLRALPLSPSSHFSLRFLVIPVFILLLGGIPERWDFLLRNVKIIEY